MIPKRFMHYQVVIGDRKLSCNKYFECQGHIREHVSKNELIPYTGIISNEKTFEDRPGSNLLFKN